MSNTHARYVTKRLRDIRAGTAVAFIWDIQDVLTYAEHIQYACDEELAKDILERCRLSHNAEQGMNWTVIDYYLCELSKPLDEPS